MTAQQLLDMLRDARELQDKAFEQSVLEQLEVDVEYVRMTCRIGAHWRYQADETWTNWRGRTSHVTNGNVFTLTSMDDVRNFRVGMTLQWSPGEEALNEAPTSMRVTAIDERAGTITVGWDEL